MRVLSGLRANPSFVCMQIKPRSARFCRGSVLNFVKSILIISNMSERNVCPWFPFFPLSSLHLLFHSICSRLFSFNLFFARHETSFLRQRARETDRLMKTFEERSEFQCHYFMIDWTSVIFEFSFSQNRYFPMNYCLADIFVLAGTEPPQRRKKKTEERNLITKFVSARRPCNSNDVEQSSGEKID